MSNSFSKLIKTGGRLHEFNFRLLSGTEKKCHVDVPDGRGNRIIFYMYKDEEGWKIPENIPAWIHSAEDSLSDVIKQVESESPHTRHSR